jgi:uncharacterized protein (TIGR02611 family)
MLESLKRRWAELRNGRPGRRFQERFERMRARSKHGALRKAAAMAAGVAIVLAGIVFLPMPGPGIAIIAVGAVLLAERSHATAKALDWLELKLRRVCRVRPDSA